VLFADAGQALAVLAHALAALALAAPGHAPCTAGKTRFHEGRTRIFQTRDGYFVCSAWLRRPRSIVEAGDGSLDAVYAFHRTGRRVAFVWSWIGGDDEGWVAAWIDVSTGRMRLINVNPLSDVPFGEGEAVVAGPDGSVAFVEKVDGGGFAIGYAPFDGRRFGAPRVVVPDSDVVPASLSLSGDTIAWRTAAGAQMSARVSAVAPAASRMVTIIGARATMASAATPSPTARASTAKPSSAVKVS
jgi:hypothetical protein